MLIENIIVLLIVTSLQKVYAQNRTFTCGVINENAPEYDAVKFAVNNTFTSSNVSIFLSAFNTSGNVNHFSQGIKFDGNDLTLDSGFFPIQTVFRDHFQNDGFYFPKVSVFLQQNVITLVEGSNTKSSACALSTLTDTPLIRLRGDSRPFGQCENAVQMSAGYRDYAHASLDILRTFRWKNVVLLFDGSRLYEAGYFHVLSQRSNLTVNLVEISEKGQNEDLSAPMSRATAELKKIKPEVILLYTRKENMEIILQEKLCLRKNYKWILQGQVPVKLSCHPNNVVLAMKLPYVKNSPFLELEKTGEWYSNANKEHVFLAYDAIQVINQALNTEPCSSVNGTLITSNDRDSMLNCIKKVNVNGVSGPVQFDEDGRRRVITMDILNLRNNSFEVIGTWNATRHLAMFENISCNMETQCQIGTLEGRKLRVVVAEGAPFVMKEKNKDGPISFTGYCIDLLNELARNFHFTYEIYPSPDGNYGAETGNGTWNGMIGELINKRADVAVAALTVTERREKVVDFTVPYMYYTKEMLIKTTSDAKIDLLQFANPFHSNVWYATIACLLIISIAVFVINYFSPYGYKGEDGRGTSEEFSLFNSAWFAVACMLQQGGDNIPRSLSGRVLTGCYWFCILILVSSYTANLAAFFTVKNTEQPIKSLDDILKSSYQVAMLSSGSTYEYFKSSQHETHRQVWQRIQEDGTLVQNTPQGIQWVREREEMAYITDGPLLRYVANKLPCDLTTVAGLSTNNGLSFAFQANNPVVTDVTLAILRLHENDFLDNLKRKWWLNECPKEQETTFTRKRIDLKSMLGVYVVMSVGIVLAFVALIAEILWKKRAKQETINLKRPKIRSVQVHPVYQTDRLP